ncbi:RsiV family protein [Acidaminobacter sp.]|uniref:RsiV family protein n=1 Tax=Acidaminobacter sp. TaxID=1872102 RepID=UPI0025654FBA|nr:RsiV family protein [Acidaminobacter sp.]MDK9712230.1 RsiV family protein [Acidaminobacter sp.]
MDPKIEKLRNAYDSIPIPDELESLVDKTLSQAMGASDRHGIGPRKHRAAKGFLVAAASLAAAFVLFVAGINLSPTFAEKAGRLPMVGQLVKVFLLREYTHQEDSYDASLQSPGIEGLENQDLEDFLNAKYLSENKALYETFMADMAALKEAGGGHLGVDSGYLVLTDTAEILSIGRYVVNTVGSSSTVFRYDTIDKVNEILITLPSLFKDDRYIDLISEEINGQMVAQHQADPNRFFWVEGIDQSVDMPLFERIAGDQSFYISTEGELVISFDKYEVAPGYMGVLTFTIPTEVLKDVLVSRVYLK